MKKMYCNYNECRRFVLKGSSRNVLSLKSEKRVIFHTTKVIVLAKIGGVFSLQISEKGYLFSVRNGHGNHQAKRVGCLGHDHTIFYVSESPKQTSRRN